MKNRSMNPRILSLLLLVIWICGAACNRKKPDFEATDEPGMPPEAPLTPAEVKPLPEEPPKDPATGPSGEPAVLLDRFNACIGSVAEAFRNAEPGKKPDPAVLSPRILECQKAFESILELGDVVISDPYKDYFLLGASVLEKLPRSENPPRTGDPPFRADEFTNAYNEFALKNNELIGIPVVELPQAAQTKTVHRRTFRDELARLAGFLEKWSLDWQFSHRFETLGTQAPTAWLLRPLPARVSFWLGSLEIQGRVRAFSVFQCDNSGTDPQDTTTCSALEGARDQLLKDHEAWSQAWRKLLQTPGAGPLTLTTERRELCEKTYQTLSDRIKALPGRVE